MDEQLKARLIGAAVLVLIAVLLVPELLSGRKPAGSAEPETNAAPGTRSFTIELGGGGAAPAGDAATPASNLESGGSSSGAGPGPDDAPEPVSEAAAAPATGTAGGAGPASGPEVPESAAPAVSTPPAEDSRSASEARPEATGAWAVQVGAFGSEKSAKKLADQLSADGFDVFIRATSRSGTTLHRVRVGPVTDRSTAERLAVRLKERKLPASVVAND